MQNGHFEQQDAKSNVDGSSKKSNVVADQGLKGDYMNVGLLLLLYTLQGIPLGLSHTMDLILQEKAISFKEQGIFSFVSLPYSIKILWAPIVDSVYLESVGRRKSWLLPVQTILGFLMVSTGEMMPYLLGEVEGTSPHVKKLTALFFIFYSLAATQDIAVDGWAVTMLERRNIGWASTCNVVGQTFGYFIAFTGFFGLKTYGLVDLSQFMRFSGMIFLVCTFAVGYFKRENREIQRDETKRLLDGDSDAEEEVLSVRETYLQMKSIMLLSTVKLLIVVLLTAPIAFAATDNLAFRKLLQRGMKKEHIASLMVFITPLGIVLPGLISKYVTDKPLSLYKWAYAPRVALSLLTTFLLYFAPDFNADANKESLPLSFFLCLVVFAIIRSVLSTAMFVAVMGFFAKVADPKIGGTYMTLLNTVANFGSNVPNQVVLFLVDKVAFASVDGFYVVNIFCVCIGLIWYLYFGNILDRLQSFDVHSWHVSSQAKKQKI
eukprot:CAMPEP_0184016946 /NCGR_PEP_ID=MMETSP0954-20121128/7224_1 /TAXON_ID=627963 /ORGANISM="Aplanochytrium sp, Strain PBS07" /LENGTH=489 /DNA_ID=CAMNT_0026298049 /DNA_START=466 /DNA_END=1935 /DNA_ORIENTATION=+